MSYLNEFTQYAGAAANPLPKTLFQQTLSEVHQDKKIEKAKVNTMSCRTKRYES
jgi:hypothetical protein